MLSAQQCQQARLSRDKRFDGLFYIAVQSTGIYCRPVCPARLPDESGVSYYPTATAAAAAGYRPCLRCRPDSAPGSPAWQGSNSTLQRALRLIAEGALIDGDQSALVSRLGISERYLRKLFQRELGVSPKQYALYQQLLFAKTLLHQTTLPVADIALQAGFHSVRRFNDAFNKQLQLTPSQIRRKPDLTSTPMLSLKLPYRPPLNWDLLIQFWQARSLDGLEWLGQQSYGRTFSLPAQQATTESQSRCGWFEVTPASDNHLQLTLYWPYPDGLNTVIAHIRRLLDLDADMMTIEQQLLPFFGDKLQSGIRIPGVWSAWEAAVRAVLGQQVSVAGARTQLNRLVSSLGSDLPLQNGKKLFPTPAQIIHSDLSMIKVPQARRDTLWGLAKAVAADPLADPDSWLSVKGIGPWTVAYSKMRGLSDSDIWLAGDLGIQKALAARENPLSPASLSPWRSYATLQLWFGLPAKKATTAATTDIAAKQQRTS